MNRASQYRTVFSRAEVCLDMSDTVHSQRSVRRFSMYKTTTIFSIAIFAAFALACGSGSGTSGSGKTIKSGPVGNLTVTLANSDGVLKKGKQDLTVTFADSSGKPVDVGSASVNFFMPAMGSMSAMNNP